MTLVVARLDRNEAYVASDTMLSHLSGEELPHHSGMLKTVIVNLQCCISYAGLTHFANKAIKHLLNNHYGSVGEVLEYLTQIHLESNGCTDFGVVTNIDETPRLYSLKNFRAGRNLQNFWLGDRYNLFQQYYAEEPECDRVKSKMRHALERVSQDRSASGIGGFVISVSTDHDSYMYEDSNGARKISGFSYDLGALYQFDGPILVEAGGEAQPVEGGSNDQVSMFSSISPDFPGVALHYGHSGVGVLFCPHLQNQLNSSESVLDPIIYKDVDQTGFLNGLKSNHGISFRGLVSDNSGRLTYVNT